jgi:CheY-like chemotaxis protein/HPt (histidine-containing phosphotransfer) domain-containing protein
VSLFGVPANSRGLTLTAHVDPSIPVILSGDPHRLRQILSNLVGNAVKFTAQGGVSIRADVADRTAEVTLLRFEVSDTGMGIEADGIARLFAPFVQIDSSATRRFDGTGLGLAICKRLVGLMGGEIGVDSTPGVGSTFWFTARLATPTDSEAGGVLADNENSVLTASLIGARVLVAEDNSGNMRLIERLLERLGIEATVVANGRLAVEAARNGGVDLVLMDCHMPEMDGFAATRAIRSEGSTVPIIALTADAMSGDRETCLAAGMNDYLPKPIVPGDLAAILRRWLPEGRAIGHFAGGGVVAPMDRLAVIDAGQIAELLELDPNGEAGFLAAMVDSYLETVAETVPAIRAALAGSDPNALDEAAHRLKGVAGNLGARCVFDCAARLVALGRARTTVGGDAIFAELEEALVPANEALARLRAGAVGASNPDTRAA